MLLRTTALLAGSVRAMTTLTFVTGNAKKLEEVTAILQKGSPLPFTIGNQALDLPELQGEPDEIAREKGKLAAEAAKGPIMCEVNHNLSFSKSFSSGCSNKVLA